MAGVARARLAAPVFALCLLRRCHAGPHVKSGSERPAAAAGSKGKKIQVELDAATHNRGLSVGAWAGGGDYLIVSARNDEDMSFLHRHHDPVGRPVMVLDKTSNARGDCEGSTYLWFIIHHYHRLPTWIFFMHAHEFHWHHASSVLRSMMLAPNRTGLGYLNVNHGDPDRKTQPYEMMLFIKNMLPQVSTEEHELVRSHLLGLKARFTGEVAHAPCGQFWVHRDRILARPRAYWMMLYQAVVDPSNWLNKRVLGLNAGQHGYPNRTLSVFFLEGYWHYIMGEKEQYELPYELYDELPTALYQRKRIPGGRTSLGRSAPS